MAVCFYSILSGSVYKIWISYVYACLVHLWGNIKSSSLINRFKINKKYFQYSTIHCGRNEQSICSYLCLFHSFSFSYERWVLFLFLCIHVYIKSRNYIICTFWNWECWYQFQIKSNYYHNYIYINRVIKAIYYSLMMLVLFCVEHNFILFTIL